MSQRGAGKTGPHGRGKGLSKPDIKRHRREAKVTEQDLLAGAFKKPAIRRMIRRGGGKRIASTVYGESRLIAAKFLHDVVRRTLGYTASSRRITVSAADVVYGLKQAGFPLFGALLKAN